MSLPPRIARATPPKSAAKAEDKKIREARTHVALVKQIGICAATGFARPVDPHHLMTNVIRGMSFKAAGRYVIPICRKVHIEITDSADPESVLLARYGLLARELADALWAVSPDLTAMIRVTERAHQEAAMRLRVGLTHK